MRSLLMATGLVVAAGLFASGCGDGDHAEGEGHEGGAVQATAEIAQKTCPVMTGNKINMKLYVDHDGKRVYFCCPECVETFKKNPEKYLKKLAAQGVTLAATPSEKKDTAGDGNEGHDH